MGAIYCLFLIYCRLYVYGVFMKLQAVLFEFYVNVGGPFCGDDEYANEIKSQRDDIQVISVEHNDSDVSLATWFNIYALFNCISISMHSYTLS